MEEKKFTLRVVVEIYDRSRPDRLNIAEEFQISPRGFMEMCAVLAEFHKLAEQFREER